MGGPGAQQGTDSILIQDNETKQNRMYGYIIMASSVVVLAILMVRIVFSLSHIDFFISRAIVTYTRYFTISLCYRYLQYSAAIAQIRP